MWGKKLMQSGAALFSQNGTIFITKLQREKNYYKKNQVLQSAV